MTTNTPLKPVLLLGMEEKVFNKKKNEMRIMLEKEVQQEINEYEKLSVEVSSLENKRKYHRCIATAFGEIELCVTKGKSSSGKWEAPSLKMLGIRENQIFSPDLEKRMCEASLVAGSYEAAQKILEGNWVYSSSSSIQRVVERIGTKAKDFPLEERHPFSAGSDDILIIMADGWFARHRYRDWGTKRNKTTEDKKERIHWYEIRSCTLFKLSDLAVTSNKRRELIHKFITVSPSDTSLYDFSVMLEHDARRMGLTTAKKTVFVMDGGIWLWNMHKDRFESCSKALLDFYHLSEHLHSLASVLYSEDEKMAKQWCKTLLHSLKHHSNRKLFKTFEELAANPTSQEPHVVEAIRKEMAYCEKHRNHMDYAGYKREGIPIGSGSVESLCSQLQNRLKRTGQFWSKKGFAAILMLIVRYRNDEFNSLWVA